MSRTLVVGASGTVGSELVKCLKNKGHEVVRATSKSKRESDQVFLNLVTGEGIEQAFQGVTRAFLLSPPPFTNQDEILNPLVDEATVKGLEKVVLMTAMGADADESSPMRKAEVHLQRSGLVYNIVRPNWLMQNFHTFWLGGIQKENKILLPVGKAKGSFVDARDIAATAAELLGSDQQEQNADFDLTGPQALDHDEVAEILSKVTDRKITYQEISPEAMLARLLEAKLPRNYAEFLVLILSYFKAGYSERTTDSVERITGRKPINFEQYARDFRGAWSETSKISSSAA